MKKRGVTNNTLRELGNAATVVMGISPKGDSYNHDLLLSKLISGELDVSELDIQIPEEAVS